MTFTDQLVIKTLQVYNMLEEIIAWNLNLK